MLSSSKRTAVGYSVPGRVVLFAACFAAQAVLSVKVKYSIFIFFSYDKLPKHAFFI